MSIVEHPFSIQCRECGATPGNKCQAKFPADFRAFLLWKLYKDPNPFIHMSRWLDHYPNSIDWSA